MRLYDHQQKILDQVRRKPNVEFYIDMGGEKLTLDLSKWLYMAVIISW